MPRIQLELQRAIGAAWPAQLLQRAWSTSSRPGKPAGLHLGARPRAGNWPHLMGQLLQRAIGDAGQQHAGRAALHLIDVLLEAVNDRQACT